MAEPVSHPNIRTQMSISIYLDNKYTKTYYQIINRAKYRTKPTEYTEKHHIIPKCSGGVETVVLTFKEHWVCHHLLLKMVTGKLLGKMYYAFDRMGQTGKNHKGRIVNPKMFSRIKIANKDVCSGENSPSFRNKFCLGRKISKESKKKNSESHKGRKSSIKTKNKLKELHSRLWKIIFPNGSEQIIKNLKQFCTDNNLSRGCMCAVSQGKRNHHHRFKCFKYEEKRNIENGRN
jgi:hypothetical protein